MHHGRGWYGRWYKHGWWCPRHPWPPAWARTYWCPPSLYYPVPVDPSEELRMLEDMKRDLEENMKRLEIRIRELKEAVEKEKAQ